MLALQVQVLLLSSLPTKIFAPIRQQSIAEMAEEGNMTAQYHLGSVKLLTDSTGNVVQALSYLPYGEESEYLQNNRYFVIFALL